MQIVLALSVLASLACLLAPFICFMMSSNTHKNEKHNLSTEEIEEAMEYAAMFGLDNDITDFNVMELIRIGRKYKEELGVKKIKDIARKHREYHGNLNRITMKDTIVKHSTARRHHVNQVISEHGLLNMETLIAAFTKILTGGSKNDESAANVI